MGTRVRSAWCWLRRTEISRQRTNELTAYALGAAIGFALSVSTGAVAQSYSFGASALTLPDRPFDIVCADLNSDGRPDLAVTDGAGISVFLGRPDGSFSARADYPAAGAVKLAVADFNGDGRPDLAMIASSAPLLRILIGNGDGSFQSPVTVPLQNSTSVSDLAAGDFNKDGKGDLAVSAAGSWGQGVAVLLGNGNGNFAPELDYAAASSFSVVVGDFDGDGKSDLAVGSGYTGGADSVSVLLGRGDGTFKPYLATAFSSNGTDSLAIGDFNRDGKLDLVIASQSSFPGGVFVLLGNGDGSFGPAVAYPTPQIGAYTDSVVVADFNGDGKLDIAATNYSTNDLSVFIGKGDGTFKPAVDYPASFNPVGLVAGDFNGDGQQDIASIADYILSHEVTVLIGKGNGTFADHVNHTVPLYPYTLLPGDFNGDGKPDLMVTSINNPGSVSVLLNKGGGLLQKLTNKKVNRPFAAVVGDFNGDGRLDVVVSDSDRQTGSSILSTLLGNGDGTLRAPVSNSSPFASYLVAADFDLDGKLDVAAAGSADNAITIFRGLGDGRFIASASASAGDLVRAMYTADLNGDHKADLAISTNTGISVFLGNGDGTFQSRMDMFPGDTLIGVGDFNAEGKTDLVVYTGTPFVGIALGNGTGSFQTPQTVYVADIGVDRSVVGDFNGDGNLDFAFISSSDQMLSILPGNGNGTFGPRIDLPTENSPWSLAAGDFTGSGGFDLAVGVAQLGSNGALSIYSNRPVGALYPSSLQFGRQSIGTTSAPMKTTLYNSGGTPLVISSITIKGDYAQTNTCGAGLGAGGSCETSITFTPTMVGNRKGSLSIQDNSTVKPQKVSLSGIAVK